MNEADDQVTKEAGVMDTRDDTRGTDYGADVAATELHSASADFDPDTGRRLKKAALIGAIVLGVVFLAVCIDRFAKARGLARGTADTAAAAPVVDVVSAQPVGA